MIHIIMDHVEDYVLLTGKALGKVSDQIVESCHSALNKRLVSSGYHRKNLETDAHGEKNVFRNSSFQFVQYLISFYE